MSKDNVTLLSCTPDKQRAQLEEFKRNLGVTVEFLVIDAQLKRVKYLALVAQGFTEAQALELCK